MLDSIKEICSSIANMGDGAQIERLFGEIMTEGELKDLALRWQLMKDLSDGFTQREIAEKYGMSLCKITRGSKILKDPNSICKNIIENLRQRKNNVAKV